MSIIGIGIAISIAIVMLKGIAIAIAIVITIVDDDSRSNSNSNSSNGRWQVTLPHEVCGVVRTCVNAFATVYGRYGVRAFSQSNARAGLRVTPSSCFVESCVGDHDCAPCHAARWLAVAFPHCVAALETGRTVAPPRSGSSGCSSSGGSSSSSSSSWEQEFRAEAAVAAAV